MSAPRRLIIAVVLAASAALPQAANAQAAVAAPATVPATSVPTSVVAASTRPGAVAGVAGPDRTAVTPRSTLRPGTTGPAVTALQQRLGALGYWVGKPTGHYGHATTQAVMALQKVAGLGRDGVAGPSTQKALAAGIRPKARTSKGRVVEIDLRRQVLMLVVDGKVRYVINTSTGAPATPTPTGSFRIFRSYNGWRQAPLGGLYRPKYFHRGIAVHGVRDGGIPGYAASHGCARVGMAAMDMLWSPSGLRNGDRVRVY